VVQRAVQRAVRVAVCVAVTGLCYHVLPMRCNVAVFFAVRVVECVAVCVAVCVALCVALPTHSLNYDVMW